MLVTQERVYSLMVTGIIPTQSRKQLFNEDHAVISLLTYQKPIAINGGGAVDGNMAPKGPLNQIIMAVHISIIGKAAPECREVLTILALELPKLAARLV